MIQNNIPPQHNPSSNHPVWSAYILEALRRLQGHWSKEQGRNLSLEATRILLSPILKPLVPPNRSVTPGAIATWHTTNSNHRIKKPLESQVYLAIATILHREGAADRSFLQEFLTKTETPPIEQETFFQQSVGLHAPRTPNHTIKLWRVKNNSAERLYEKVRAYVQRAERSIYILNNHLDDSIDERKIAQPYTYTERWRAAMDLLSSLTYYNTLVLNATRTDRPPIRYHRLIQVPDVTEAWHQMGFAYRWHLVQMAQIAAQQRQAGGVITIALKQCPPTLDTTFVIVDEHTVLLQLSRIHNTDDPSNAARTLQAIVMIEDNDHLNGVPREFMHLFHEMDPALDDGDVYLPIANSATLFEQEIGTDLLTLIPNTIRHFTVATKMKGTLEQISRAIGYLTQINDAHPTLARLHATLINDKELRERFTADYIPYSESLRLWWQTHLP